MSKKDKQYYKDTELLSRRKAHNSVFVYNGTYELDEIVTDRDSMTIEELAYICAKSGKGLIASEDEMIELLIENSTGEETDTELTGYTYCDLSQYGMRNCFLCINNLHADGVEVHS